MENILVKKFEINNNNIIFGIELLKSKNNLYLLLKAIKLNSINSHYYTRKITIEYFNSISTLFESIQSIDSILTLLLELIDSNNLSIKKNTKINNILTIIIYYKSNEIKIFLEKELNTFEEKNFYNNPNIFLNTVITEENDSCGISDIFEVFDDKANNYLASPNQNTHDIDIYNIDNIKLIKSLKGHLNFITFIKYFFDILKSKKYLMSIDDIKLIIIWDITNNLKIYSKINIKYTGLIYSSILLFNINNNKDYLITSSNNKREFSKLYSLNLENCEYIRDIFSTNENNTKNIISWGGSNDNDYYIIELCDNKITIIKIFEDEKYAELIVEDDTEKYDSAFIYNKSNEDYLYASTWYGNVYVWNLNEKILVENIDAKIINGISYMIHWSDNIVVGTDFANRGIFILDIKYNKVISKVSNIHEKGVVCVKKIKNKKGQEMLITASNDNKIKIWNTQCINISYIQ